MTASSVPPPSLVWSSLESRRHDCDNNHERPDRVRAAASKLESDDELASICRRIDLGLETSTAATKNQPTPRARAAAEAVHSRAYLSRLQALCNASAASKGPFKVADEDDETEFTYVTETSLSDALAAVEAALSLWDLVDDAPSSSPRAVLALVRPPGHHAGRGVEGAEPDSPEGAPSGFCLVNTAAAVARAVAAGRAGGRGCSSSSSSARRRRVLVIDWDVHVGDGTQDIFWGHPRGRGRRAKKGGGEKSGGDEPCGGGADGEEKGEEGEEDVDDEEESVCVIDLHEAGAWPGGGGIELRGHPGSSSSRVVNVPLPSGSGDAAARAAFERVVIPFAARFRPEAIVVSAGFDAHELEPLAGLRWTDATYAFLGAAAARLAESHGPRCGLLFVLEG